MQIQVRSVFVAFIRIKTIIPLGKPWGGGGGGGLGKLECTGSNGMCICDPFSQKGP